MRLLSPISGGRLDGIRYWTRRKRRPRARIDAKRVASLVKEEDNQKEAEKKIKKKEKKEKKEGG